MVQSQCDLERDLQDPLAEERGSSNSIQVVIFTGFFALFFALCLVVISALLGALGVI